MRTAILEGIKQPLQIQESPSPKPQNGEARIGIQAAAWNKRDYWITQGKYPGIQTPAVLGSDGAGIVLECPDAPQWVGKEVLLCPSLNWGNNPRFQSMQYSILGMPSVGTTAEEICVPIENLVEKPAHLSQIEAAAIPLAGLTAWRALVSKANVQSGERVLVTGIGGGTAVFVLQFALALGADVWVTSSSQIKIEQAINLGAKGGALYTDDNWAKQLQRLNPRGFDVIIDSAGGDGFGDLVRILGMGGRLAFFGGTAGKWPQILPQYLFFKQVSILATTMGSPQEFQEMVQCIDKHHIKPVVDSTFSLETINNSMQRMLHPERFGKVTIDMRN